jgi:hypothetical protein
MNPNYQKKWLLLIIVSIVALGLTAAIPAKGPASPWRGTWWSIDPFDGSLQKVVFTGQDRFIYIDFGASVCGKDSNGNPIYAAHSSGLADTVDDSSFIGSGPIICMTHPPYIWSQDFPFSWTYVPATDTLLDDGLQTIWTRTRP